MMRKTSMVFYNHDEVMRV